uniref:cellulase n=1 Tax=Evansstolkia leycettana TaxID=196907 RepID=A0A3G5ECP2_9EURO|nr:endoglucanase GH5 [Evansstolkia leycettana]
MKFSNVILAASASSLVLAAPKSKTKRTSAFQWFGANESGAEFGNQNIPGTLGTDYTWPDTSTIQTLRNAGMNIFRVPFLMERLVPNQMTGSPDPTYLADLKSTVNFITGTGAYAVVDPHNYGRYYNNIITSTSDFAAFWTTVASQFASNPRVIFDTNNEYNNMDQTLVLNLNQAAINAIRAAGATSQYIFAEGNSWTGAWTWTSVNDNMKQLTDPSNKLVYEMHQYLDSDGSGTSDQCVNSTIGYDRIVSATQWLQANGKVAFLGEFAGGSNSVCEAAVTGMLDYMEQNSDVWLGAEWWAAGPWWGNYIYSMEPPSGIAYQNYLSILEPYFPGGSYSGGTGSGSGSTTTTATTTTTKVPPTSTTSSASSTGTGVAQHWGQCGGQGWTGPTTCVSPYTCQELNPYYYQCL